jgi:hypothetical protein
LSLPGGGMASDESFKRPFSNELNPWVVTKSGRIVVATIWQITSSNCH